MKVEIITLHAVANYGSVLQAFATQELFKEYGHDVKIINYIKKENAPETLLKYWCGNNLLKKIVMFPTIKKWKSVFSQFNADFLNLTTQSFTFDSDFKTYPLEADVYCTGSDQVWNSVWNNGILAPLYLDFVPNTKYKFSFAASFGQEKLSQVEIDQTKIYLSQYKWISVREQSAKKIIEEQYGLENVVRIVDPTLSMPPEFWRTFEPRRQINEDYILIYNLNRSKEFDLYAKELSRKTGLKLVRLCYRYDQILRVGKSVIMPEVFEFISLLDNAKYVLTDSFHATAFSINLNTEPICIYPQNFGERIKSFLELVDATDRHVMSYHDFSIIERNTNFEHINKILRNERVKVRTFLKTVFDDAERTMK